MSKKAYPFLFTFLVAFPMCFIMSLGATLFNFGLSETFFSIWFRSFWFGFLLGYPTALVVVPIARKAIEKIKWK